MTTRNCMVLIRQISAPDDFWLEPCPNLLPCPIHTEEHGNGKNNSPTPEDILREDTEVAL